MYPCTRAARMLVHRSNSNRSRNNRNADDAEDSQAARRTYTNRARAR